MKKGNVLSEVNQTLMDQLRTLNPFFIAEYNIKCVIQINDNKVRLHSRNRGKVVNIDIAYNEGLDLYEIQAYRVNGLSVTCEQIKDVKEVYFDQLHDIIRGIFSIIARR